MPVPESVEKLGPIEKRAWERTYDLAGRDGFDDEQSQAIAWAFVNRGRGWEEYLLSETPSLYLRYPLARPGTYDPEAGGTLTLGKKEIQDICDALNYLSSIGKPCTLIPGHGADWAIGTIPAAVVEEDVCYGCLVYDLGWDVGIRTGAYGLSMEAGRNFKDETYTGGRTFSVFPVNWAVLPANVLPAVPPGEPLAASGSTKKMARVRLATGAPDRGTTPQGKEADEVDMKELEGRIVTLEGTVTTVTQENASLKARIGELETDLRTVTEERDGLKAEKDAKEVEARQAAFDVRKKALIEAESRPGVRQKIEEEIEKAETLEDKERVLASFETVCAALDPAKIGVSKLKAGKDDETSEKETAVTAAKRIQAEGVKAGRKIPFPEALAQAVKAKVRKE